MEACWLCWPKDEHAEAGVSVGRRLIRDGGEIHSVCISALNPPNLQHVNRNMAVLCNSHTSEFCDEILHHHHAQMLTKLSRLGKSIHNMCIYMHTKYALRCGKLVAKN